MKRHCKSCVEFADGIPYRWQRDGNTLYLLHNNPLPCNKYTIRIDGHGPGLEDLTQEVLKLLNRETP